MLLQVVNIEYVQCLTFALRDYSCIFATSLEPDQMVSIATCAVR